MVVEALDALGKVIGTGAVDDGLDVEVDEPGQRVLVHGLNVGQVRDAEEQDGRMGGHGTIPVPSLINLLFGDGCNLLQTE